jgi:UDP-N-acetylglucosamine 2-epimerase
MPKVLTVVGARPQFVKAAVLSRYLRTTHQEASFRELIVHTGQHYDGLMSDVFFRQLEIAPPACNLEVGSGTGARQLAAMLERLDPVVTQEQPDAVLVYGDTNSTLAAAIVATRHDIPLVHVEAGERMFRRHQVPEEVNRVLTDNAASLCLTSTQRAAHYLRREGMSPHRVRFVGDPMYDLYRWARAELPRTSALGPADFGLTPEEYHLATIHRAENTASREQLIGLLKALDAAPLPVVLPVHPRVRDLLKQWHWTPENALRLVQPLGYFDFLSMLISCRSVVTDSGGVTREAYFARKPCIIPMDSSWWVEIVEAGWAVEVGSDTDALLAALTSFAPPNESPEGLFGDGRSAERIVREIDTFLAERRGRDAAWHLHGSFDVLPRPRATAFTYRNYQRMLERFLDAGYSFAPFEEAESRLESRDPFVLLRHDVDVDLERAVRMGEAEAALGVRSTFFLMVRTDHYNIFSRAGTDLVGRLTSMGHSIALHFDCAAYPEAENPCDYSRACIKEARMLSAWFKRDIRIVSFHRPSALILTGDPELSAPLPHTYMDLYTRQIRYMSDSRGGWRNEEPTQTPEFARRAPLHLLIHPIWWNEHPTTPYESLLRFVDDARLRLEVSLARNSASYRVGWLNDALEE